MTQKVRIALVGTGAFGIKHLDGLKNIDHAEVTFVVGSSQAKAQVVAEQYGIPNAVGSLDEALASDQVDAVILCTPTQMHASQSLACL